MPDTDRQTIVYRKAEGRKVSDLQFLSRLKNETKSTVMRPIAGKVE